MNLLKYPGMYITHLKKLAVFLTPTMLILRSLFLQKATFLDMLSCPCPGCYTAPLLPGTLLHISTNVRSTCPYLFRSNSTSPQRLFLTSDLNQALSAGLLSSQLLSAAFCLFVCLSLPMKFLWLTSICRA